RATNSHCWRRAIARMHSTTTPPATTRAATSFTGLGKLKTDLSCALTGPPRTAAAPGAWRQPKAYLAGRLFVPAAVLSRDGPSADRPTPDRPGVAPGAWPRTRGGGRPAGPAPPGSGGWHP